MTDNVILTPEILASIDDIVKPVNVAKFDRGEMLNKYVRPAIEKSFQHILKEDVTLDAVPFSTIPAGTPIFGEEEKGFIVFQFGEYKRQILKKHFNV